MVWQGASCTTEVLTCKGLRNYVHTMYMYVVCYPQCKDSCVNTLCSEFL